jgi:hypothetical protein
VAVVGILFSFEWGSRGFETDGLDEDIEIIDDALVKAVELRSPFGFEPSVWLDRAQNACGERRIDPFEQPFTRVAVREELIAARVGELGDKALGTQLRDVIAERSERVMFGGAAERFDDGGVDFGSGEGIAGRNVCEAHERMHEGELPRVIELEARNAFSRRGDRRFRKFSQLAAIDKGFKDILLHVEIVVDDR